MWLHLVVDRSRRVLSLAASSLRFDDISNETRGSVHIREANTVKVMATRGDTHKRRLQMESFAKDFDGCQKKNCFLF